jgi:hypothetical protein
MHRHCPVSTVQCTMDVYQRTHAACQVGSRYMDSHGACRSRSPPASSISICARHAATHFQQLKRLAMLSLFHTFKRKKLVSERTTPNCPDLKPFLLAPPGLLCSGLHVNLDYCTVCTGGVVTFVKTSQGGALFTRKKKRGFVLDSCIYTLKLFRCVHIYCIE